MAWTNRIVGQGEEAPDQLLANPLNFRVHPKAQQAALTGALDTIGWVQQVVVNRQTGHIVDGHLRVSLALRDNQPTIPVLYVDLTEAEEAQALLSLDPIAAMAATDKSKMDELFRAVETDNEQVQKYLSELAEREGLDYGKTPPADDPGAQVDRAEELRAKWGVETGQLWALGEHRLICGDCTDRAVVDRVMGGERAGAVVTDPPYGQNQVDVPGDDPEGNLDLLIGCAKNIPVDNGIVIAFQSPRTFPNWLKAIESCDHKFLRALWLYKEAQMANPWRGWILKSEMIIVSEIGRGEWLEVHPYAHDCYKLAEVSYRTEKLASVRPHGSVKPLSVVQDLVSRVAGTIYEPFSGSGTTLIACEQLNRRCRAVEISPGYVAVALERWAQMTGKTPELLP